MMELKYDFCRCMMAVGLTITLAACSDHVIDATNEGTNATSTYEFNAYIDAGNSTRTSMGELKDGKYPVVWSEGDKVFLFASSGKSYDATLLSGSGTQKAIFKGGCWYLPACIIRKTKCYRGLKRSVVFAKRKVYIRCIPSLC